MANIVYIATSLDGYIAGVNGELDWLMKYPNPENSDFGFGEFMSRVDGIVMGRSTFDLVVTFGEWPYPKPVFVLSSTLEEVPEHHVSRYGIVAGEDIGDGLVSIRDMIEKPSRNEAPSNLAVASRYILPPEIFSALEVVEAGKGGEIQLTDAIRILLSQRPLYGCRINGRRHDLGNKLDFLKTSVLFALKRTDMKDDLAEWIKELAANL